MGILTIENTSGGTPPYQFYLDTDTLAAGQEIVAPLAAGVYDLVTIDAQQCVTINEVPVYEPDLFSMDLGEDQTVALGASVALELNVVNGTGVPIIEIEPREFIDCPEESDLMDCPLPAVVLPNRSITYQVVLTDENGCTTEDEIQITIDTDEDYVYMPNAFSPNADGKNDFFFVQGTPAVESVTSFLVFNRWGGRVFYQKDFPANDKTFGWDGRQNGSILDSGVFIWVITYRTIDGVVHRMTGDVTIFK